MRRTLVTAAAVLLALFAGLAPAADAPSARKTLTAFASEAELSDVLRRWAEDAARRNAERRARLNAGTTQANAMPESAPAPTMAAKAEASKEDAVTNVQHAGVDEGGIVKVHGDHLVILRRGRLFTVAIGDRAAAAGRRDRRLRPRCRAARARGTTRC